MSDGFQGRAPGLSTPYLIDVSSAPNAKALSAVSWRIVECMDEHWRITRELTHPEALVREDCLGKEATFPGDGEPRPFQGRIAGFHKLKILRFKRVPLRHRSARRAPAAAR